MNSKDAIKGLRITFLNKSDRDVNTFEINFFLSERKYWSLYSLPRMIIHVSEIQYKLTDQSCTSTAC